MPSNNRKSTRSHIKWIAVLCSIILTIPTFIKSPLWGADEKSESEYDPLEMLPIRGLVFLGTEIVRNDLAVSQQQRNQLDALREQVITKWTRLLQDRVNGNGPDAENSSYNDETINPLCSKGVSNILNPSQRARLSQLMLQYQAELVLHGPLFRGEIGITPIQTKRIEEIFLEMCDKINALPIETDDTDEISDESSDANLESSWELEQTAISETMKILTPDQKANLEKIWGKQLEHTDLARQVEREKISISVTSDKGRTKAGFASAGVSYR